MTIIVVFKLWIIIKIAYFLQVSLLTQYISVAFSSQAIALAFTSLFLKISILHPLLSRASLLFATSLTSNLYLLSFCGYNHSILKALLSTESALLSLTFIISYALSPLSGLLVPFVGSMNCYLDLKTYCRFQSCCDFIRVFSSNPRLYNFSSGLVSMISCLKDSSLVLWGYWGNCYRAASEISLEDQLLSTTIL